VSVFPGPLAVVQLELERLSAGGSAGALGDGGYGFAVASEVASLSASANVPVDDAVLRRIRLLGWQRIVRLVRAPDPATAVHLLTSLRRESSHPQAAEAVPRLVQVVTQAQRADGTWSFHPTSTLQAVLVETATSARVLPESERGAILRAEAAVERYAAQVNDPYTAAVLLASGLADGDLAGPLLARVTDAIHTDDDTGERWIEPPVGVVNAWGAAPSRAELLAWTVLALPTDAPERGDLAAALMQGWSSSSGFGAGPFDAVALEAMTSTLPTVSAPIALTLTIDGTSVASATLDPGQPRVPAMLAAPAGAVDAPFVVTASPPMPGLAFVATRRSWVPWSDADRMAGVDLEIQAPPFAVGREGVV
ncbi:MAG: hypothetical protein ABMB14_41340, partial [Myxococcota bacterium]